MQLTNWKCNSLACIIGLFCHSTSTPELLIEMLMHAGLSISLTAIHDMIDSLSQKAHEKLKHVSKSLLASFVYDNFDMDFMLKQGASATLHNFSLIYSDFS